MRKVTSDLDGLRTCRQERSGASNDDKYKRHDRAKLDRIESDRFRTDLRSPNFTATPISVEFLVLHYTAGDLERALSIFTDPARRVSCHLLIAEDGEVFELVQCLSGPALQAAHAGVSHFDLDGCRWTMFNEFSIGIELVNPNGNLIDYSGLQYVSLAKVVAALKKTYPSLQNPTRVVGHEHIAGWRGKADPGYCFSWGLFFEQCYPAAEAPTREPVCPAPLRSALSKFLECCPTERDERVRFWHAISATLEAAVALIRSST